MKNSDQAISQAVEILQGKSIDAFEVYLHESSHFNVESKDGKVDSLEASHALGAAFRTLKGGKMGFSYTTILNPSQSEKEFRETLERTIEDAVSGSDAATADPSIDFATPSQTPLPKLPIFDETIGNVSENIKIEKAKTVERAARSADPARIHKVRKASYQEAVSHTTLINSHGLHVSYASSLASVSVTAIAEEAGESEMGWDFDYSHFGDDLDVEKVGRTAGKKALERLGGRRISSGVYPAILENRVASEFLSLLAHSFLAEQVQKGKSPLKNRKGTRFFSPSLSIVDDGLYPKGISTSPVDGEGTVCQRTSLVVRGEVSGYLYDLYWARREVASSGSQTRSTGNSRRMGIKFPPVLGVSTLLIEPGDIPFSGLLKELNRGVVVEDVMGLHMVDPISGDFSLGCSGSWIDGGERKHPVKSIAIAGNLFDIFRKVVKVGEDLRFFGEVGSPSLFIESLEISGN